MEYRVLARKYRPQTFDDLVGQEVLVRTLSNAFSTGRVAHAFLLTGIRGVGKTTTARIIARALNCIGADGHGPMTISPCGVCTHCTMIAESRHMDVLEMDAASHTSVEGIRDLITTVQYLPTSARTKVYIIDEVHMLSNSAFNALLKTLEEPPPHVKFIFATTEIRKIPVTILSRCQRFDLKRLSTTALAKHLANVAAKEAIQIDEEALLLLANAAEGSVRDSLSLFDQAIAHSDVGGMIQAATVRSMLGMNDKSQLFGLLEALLTGETATSLAEFRALYESGADPATLFQELLSLIHFITRLKVTPDAASDITFAENERVFATSLAARMNLTTLTKVWQMLLKGLQEIRMAPDPVSAAEIILIRISYSADLPSPSDLIRFLRKQEVPLKGEVSASTSASTPSSMALAPISLITTQQQVSMPSPSHVVTPQPQLETSPVLFADIAEMFLKHREMRLHTLLMRNVHLVRFEKGRIELNVDSEVPVDFAGRVGKHLSDWTGERWMVILSHEAGEPTLQSLKDEADSKEREALKHHPLVVSVLEQFPEATLTTITKG